MSSLLNLPESYEFECGDETSLRTFRYPNVSMIEFSKVRYRHQTIDENSIDIKGKRIAISIGEINPSKKKSRKNWGTLTNYDEDVAIQIAYEDKQFQELIHSLENVQNLKNIFIAVEIYAKEAKKKATGDMDTYSVDNFKIVKRIK